jgi:hypothetical protein
MSWQQTYRRDIKGGDTYAAAKDLRLLYLDGMSAAKTSKGTLDSQDAVLFFIGFLRCATTWRAMVFLVFVIMIPLPQFAMASSM